MRLGKGKIKMDFAFLTCHTYRKPVRVAIIYVLLFTPNLGEQWRAPGNHCELPPFSCLLLCNSAAVWLYGLWV